MECDLHFTGDDLEIAAITTVIVVETVQRGRYKTQTVLVKRCIDFNGIFDIPLCIKQ